MTKIVQSFQRSIIMTFICAIFVVVVVSYYTISGIVNEQGKRQQESIIPFFSLISQQILRPLYISQTMANDQLLLDLIDQQPLNADKLESHLKHVEKTLGLQTFIALEKPLLQINSDGRRFAIDQEVEWYHQVKDKEGEQFAMIGKSGDPHLYVDLRLRNRKGEFLGFIGVGIRLVDFIELFEQYRQHFGYDFVFVNENAQIMLSSDQKLMSRVDPTTENVATDVSQLTWFNAYKSYVANNNAVIGSAVINIEDEDVLISNLRLHEYSWDLYVLSPLTTHQTEIRFLLIRNVAILCLVLLVIFGLISLIIRYFDKALVKSTETDHLTGLPNRHYAEWSFNKMRQNFNSVAVILSDIDRFKKINDENGHNVGDEVIKMVSQKLNTGMRDHDVVARWGGEEFIIILPGAGLTKAKLIAERIRLAICNEPVELDDRTLSVSASLGVAELTPGQSLKDLVEDADKALYVAKENGRNRVEVYTSKQSDAA